MMTRKDFIILQENMNYTKPRVDIDPPSASIQWDKDVKQLAHALKLINPSFNSQTFIDACKGGSHDTNPQDFISGG